MRASSRRVSVVLVLLCVFTLAAGSVQASKAEFQTGFDEWMAVEGDFAGWVMEGVTLNAEGELVLDTATALQETDPYAPGTYYGGNYYTGGSYLVGQATGPATAAAFDLDELIASWNAVTPARTWMEVLASAELAGRWTKWYNLGIWASDLDTIERHSVRLQGDADGYVAVDTLVLTDKKATAAQYRLRVRLFTADGMTAPRVRYVSAAYSTTATKKNGPSAGNPALWDTLLAVPECSQMVYPGGNVWCSPTSTAMIVSFWQGSQVPCQDAVNAAVGGIYDWVYDGTGNWPFNTAYASTYGLQGSVRRFGSMEDIEAWVAQGVPVAISYGWRKGELTGAAVASSSGHLSVVVGFDAGGNPIVNDPAAGIDEDVQRTYLRSELEPLWLEHSGGTVYLIKP